MRGSSSWFYSALLIHLSLSHTSLITAESYEILKSISVSTSNFYLLSQNFLAILGPLNFFHKFYKQLSIPTKKNLSSIVMNLMVQFRKNQDRFLKFLLSLFLCFRKLMLL